MLADPTVTDNALMTALTHRANVLTGRRPDSKKWLILTADWGGQVLLTVPWSLVGAEAQPLTLLKELNEIAWSCNDGGAAAYIFEPKKADEYWVGGGMGGGSLTDTLWMHKHDFRETHHVRARELLCITHDRVHLTTRS